MMNEDTARGGIPIKVLFLKPSNSTFVEQDEAILREHFDVRTIDFADISRMGAMTALFRGTIWADVTVAWFADIYALWASRLSRAFRKKCVVIFGGYETANLDWLGYGLLTTKKGAAMVKEIALSTHVLAVSETVANEVKSLAPAAYVSVIPLGVPPALPPVEKEDIVLTVGQVTMDRMMLKGIDKFAKVASHMGGTRFIVIGETDETMKSFTEATDSVEFLGQLPHDEVLSWMNRSRVYCQLSVRESFGFAVAEAMAHGCVPVVSAVANLPTLVGDTGFVVPVGDIPATIDAVENALLVSGEPSRDHIATEYSLIRREANLVREVGR